MKENSRDSLIPEFVSRAQVFKGLLPKTMFRLILIWHLIVFGL